MKVTQIRDYNRKSDDKPYWRIDFEGVEKCCLMFNKPKFSEGDEIPDKNFKLTKSGEYYIWVGDGETKSYPRKSYARPPEEMESIERQVDKKNAVEIFCHVTDAGTPFDDGKLTEIYKVCHSLGRNPVVEEAKRQYGAKEEK